MFCPGCGESNNDNEASCRKCGLNLARLRIVIAGSDPDTCGAITSDTLTKEVFPPGESAITGTISADSHQVDSATAIPCDTASLDSTDPVQLKEHGNELFRQERYLDALDCYEKALAIDQFYKEAWFNKSIVLKKIGRLDQSKVCWGIYKRLIAGVPEARKNRQL